MRLKYVLVALIGLVVGAIAGGFGMAWFVSDMTAHMIGSAWRDGSTSRLAHATTYLRLLDDGKIDALRKVLVGDLQSMTIGVAADLPDADARLLRKQIEMVGQMESIQADDSEIGKMAADARKRILDVAQP